MTLLDIFQWPLTVLVGVVSGAYGVLVGAGGGFILSPVLLTISDTEPKTIAGTVLTAIAINSALVTWTYRGMKVVDYRSGLLFAAAAVPGAVIGAFVVGEVASDIFRTLFGVLLVMLAVKLAFNSRLSENVRTGKPKHLISLTVRRRTIRTKSGEEYSYEFNEALATSFNVVLGFISSFFGIGGGFLRTPILVMAFGFPVRIAAASSVFALSIYGTAGAIAHAALGHIELFPTLVFVTAGLVVGGQIGARFSGRVRGAWLLRMLLFVVLALGIRLIWQGVTT